MWWKRCLAALLLVVAVVPAWSPDYRDLVSWPFALAQQGAPDAPQVTPKQTEQKANPATTAPVQAPVQAPQAPTPDCVWKVIDGIDQCFCRPSGSQGVFMPALNSNCG